MGRLSRSDSAQLEASAPARSRAMPLTPGMRLVREWHGTVHVVTVAENGEVLWNGRSWTSLPALELEAAVIQVVAEALDDPLALLTRAGLPLESHRLQAILKQAGKLAAAIRAKQRDPINRLLEQVIVEPHTISIELSFSALCDALGIEPTAATPSTILLTAPVRLTRTGRAVRLVQRDGRPVTAGTPDPGLIELLRKGRGWWLKLQTGTIDIATIAREEQVNDSWVSRLVRLNFLAPALVEAILAGTQPVSLTAASLRTADLPIAWAEQMAMFGLQLPIPSHRNHAALRRRFLFRQPV